MVNTSNITFLDCTLRDGGYYNSWDFSEPLVNDYLASLVPAGINAVELGFRSLRNNGFKGASAYTSDDYIRSLKISESLTTGVMINGSELIENNCFNVNNLQKLFPESTQTTPLKLVRIACHVHEFSIVLPASDWLKKKGFLVAFNLMQISERTEQEIKAISKAAAKWSFDVLYFADSLGSMNPEKTSDIICCLKEYWTGSLGIHTHDNLYLAIQNSLRSIQNGVEWIDSTVTGMGRGPGNAKTELLALEISELRGKECNILPLIAVIENYFIPLKQKHHWGSNTYYYLAGKYGIHPSYIQEMTTDARYNVEDFFAVIQHLRVKGGKKFSLDTLDAARCFYSGQPRGSWKPDLVLENREVLILGAGPSVSRHKSAITAFIKKYRPYVLAINIQNHISAELINARIACHPVRLLADCQMYAEFPQPLITPVSMLPSDVQNALKNKETLDFGIGVKANTFEFSDTFCILPNSLAIAYALAVLTSGKAKKAFLAGFDGYNADDLRMIEMEQLLKLYIDSKYALELVSITPTRYTMSVKSVYGL